MQEQGRPVLIGTGSVADSELLSREMTAAGIAHQVLNARQDKKRLKLLPPPGNGNRSP